MAQYQLKEVKTAKEAKAWLHMDRKIYEGNRNWVCPLDSDIEKVFDPVQNELFNDGEAIRWVVVDSEGEVVGRIAAFYNREQLAVKIWGFESDAEYNNVEVYMSFTRKKLSFVEAKTEIKAVRGIGYELRCDDV